MFVDGPAHMYGLYSVKQQMHKFGMDKDVILTVVVDQGFTDPGNPSTSKAWQVLQQWIDNPQENIHIVNKQFIHQKLAEGLWRGVFNKLFIFNLTMYDKILMLDADVLIRTNLRRWFDDYEAPAAVQAGDVIEWNSGVMLLEPNATVFARMMDLLPHAVRFDPKLVEGQDPNNPANVTDPLNSGYHDQGFLSSFFTAAADARDPLRMKTLPTEAAVLSTRLAKPDFRYFVTCRRHIFETIHFTGNKPWDQRGKASNPIVCDFLREWYESIDGIEMFHWGQRPNDGTNYVVKGEFLASCPPPTTFPDHPPWCNTVDGAHVRPYRHPLDFETLSTTTSANTGTTNNATDDGLSRQHKRKRIRRP
jgi:hypothetical protein